ncbi:hypothetical protein [Bifidobacterium sp. ESL0745]|uniref:hypothetical protein n=1 Tax=Bifidobacterium sp. ESL0745 TaxID=2983226 RepID=UPI0023F78B49|nr:hypothetical protein [Bifidobacterium sp. ESL0745]MDF7666185.1 hypothetical protein [Bifidobacterium sp. ESL0745]
MKITSRIHAGTGLALVAFTTEAAVPGFTRLPLANAEAETDCEVAGLADQEFFRDSHRQTNRHGEP